MGKIVRDRYPDLCADDQEAVRQHAIAALNLTQQAKKLAGADTAEGVEPKLNTALIDGVRKFAMDVRDLDIDLIDSINPFEAAYSVLAKSMAEGLAMVRNATSSNAFTRCGSIGFANSTSAANF